MTIKAIETKYKGYRFRSRLEARWAVFFDAMGIEYQYEPEGYELDGLRYLPDFWLPDRRHKYDGAGFWIEIKPGKLNPVEAEKIKRLVEHTGHHAYALAGNIGLGEYRVSKWALKRATGEVWCVHEDDIDYFLHLSMWIQLQSANARMEDALLTARGARFEFDESPTVLCAPEDTWQVGSLGLSDNDGGGRDWWVESELSPGDHLYYCGNDRYLPDAAKYATDIVEAHNRGDKNHVRYLVSLLGTVKDVEGNGVELSPYRPL